MKSPEVHDQGCCVLSVFLFVPHKTRLRNLLELSVSLEELLCSVSPQSPVFMTCS